MSVHTSNILLCMGSNLEPERHLAEARKWLESHFDVVRYSPEIETLPEGQQTDVANFHNQCVWLSSQLSLPEVLSLLKRAERELGRREEDKLQGTIHIDIDILIFDGTPIKPGDLDKAYVKRCLSNSID